MNRILSNQTVRIRYLRSRPASSVLSRTSTNIAVSDLNTSCSLASSAVDYIKQVKSDLEKRNDQIMHRLFPTSEQKNQKKKHTKRLTEHIIKREEFNKNNPNLNVDTLMKLQEAEKPVGQYDVQSHHTSVQYDDQFCDDINYDEIILQPHYKEQPEVVLDFILKGKP